MTNRLRNVVIGAVVLIAGVIGLFLPVAVWDGNSAIGCGNAVVAEQSATRPANEAPPVIPHFDYAAACESAISGRRHWAIPLTIVGAAGLLVGFFVRGRSPRAG